MTIGRPPLRSGKQWSGRVTDVPMELLQHLKLRPLPITIGGTSQRTFTLNASVTAPAVIWNGDDFIYLKSTVAYSWVAGSNAILSSAGVETTLTNGTVNVWYMYLDEDGVNIVPSATAPSYVETSLNTGVLGHPGTSRAQNWTYVGFMVCDATTPTFIKANKRGYTYHLDATDSNFATTSSWVTSATCEFNLFIPDLGAQGLTVGGYVIIQSIGVGSCFTNVLLGGDSTSSFGNIEMMGGNLSSFENTMHAFSGIVPASSGLLSTKWEGGAVPTTVPTVCITQIVDVV